VSSPTKPKTGSVYGGNSTPAVAQTAAQSAANAAARKTEVLQRVALTVLPLLLFAFHVTQIGFAAHDHPIFVCGCFAAPLFLAIFVSQLAPRKWQRRLGYLSNIANLVGGVCGAYIYCQYMVHFYGYRDLRISTNVLAVQRPEQFADVGMMLFSHSTRVDTSRSVGYRSFEDGGGLFCVAPIVDDSMSLSDPINFWAVGEDCCQARSHFECDDSDAPGVHSAVVLLNPDVYVAEALQSFTPGSPGATYDRAVRLAEHSFGINREAGREGKHVFVRWVRWPYKLQDQYKMDAGDATYWLLAVGALFFGWMGSRHS
jgi:hypothetical protein